mmetsp:Transcript_17631/g.41469  ORF Transcript_17631/g.41469 Transcript_17631/m.41469 type:complete len:203 (+) Transcript_17631:112-720(+)
MTVGRRHLFHIRNGHCWVRKGPSWLAFWCVLWNQHCCDFRGSHLEFLECHGQVIIVCNRHVFGPPGQRKGQSHARKVGGSSRLVNLRLNGLLKLGKRWLAIDKDVANVCLVNSLVDSVSLNQRAFGKHGNGRLERFQFECHRFPLALARRNHVKQVFVAMNCCLFVSHHLGEDQANVFHGHVETERYQAFQLGERWLSRSRL